MPEDPEERDSREDGERVREVPSADEHSFEDHDPSEDEYLHLRRRKHERLKFDWRHMERWQKVRLFGSIIAVVVVFGVYLCCTCSSLAQQTADDEAQWDYYLTENDDMAEEAFADSADATHVKTAIYLEQLRSVDIKNSQFEVIIEVAYRWNGNDTLDCSDADAVHFYKGQIKTQRVIDDYHQDGTNYQLVRYDVVINKQYSTPRFPLESHQLRIYLEPSLTTKNVILEPDADSSYANPRSGITGFDLTRFGVTQTIIKYDHAMLDPLFDGAADDTIYKTEVMTAIEINRADIALYFKCFIALYGTTAWILLCLYICTFRRVDPLGMIGAAFFGAVSNIMVGANLVSDSLSFGLLEYGNLFGIALIIAGTATVISINTIRNEWHGRAFACFYGRIMMAIFTVIAVVGNIALPLCAMS